MPLKMVLEVFLVSSLIEKGQGYSLGNISGGLTKSASLYGKKKISLVPAARQNFLCNNVLFSWVRSCMSCAHRTIQTPWNERANPRRPPARHRSLAAWVQLQVEGRVDSWGAPATCRCDVRCQARNGAWTRLARAAGASIASIRVVPRGR